MSKKFGSIIVLLCSFIYAALACTTSATKPDDSASGGQGGSEGGKGAGAGALASGGSGGGVDAGSGGTGGLAVNGGDGGKEMGSGGSSGGTAGSLVINELAPAATVEFGLDARPSNTTCKDPGKPTGLQNDPFPKLLSATGCFLPTDPKKPAAGLIPYGVASPLWSDNAEKQRYMALPEGKKIKLTANGDFDLPIGTVLLKTFALDTTMLETRFLIRHSDGQWGTYTYVWNEAGTDATLLGEGSDSRILGDADWIFPSRMNCLTCHTEPVGRSIGPETRQLNSVFEYGPNKRANQMKTLDHIGVFETSPGDVSKLAALPTPKYAKGATLEMRARSYLHANCSHCHQPGGTKDAMGVDQVPIDFRFDTPFAKMGICNVPPSKNNYGYPNVMILSPGPQDLGQFGELSKSMISIRMHSKTDGVRMPQLGTKVPDKLGTEIVDEWIKSIVACP